MFGSEVTSNHANHSLSPIDQQATAMYLHWRQMGFWLGWWPAVVLRLHLLATSKEHKNSPQKRTSDLTLSQSTKRKENGGAKPFRKNKNYNENYFESFSLCFDEGVSLFFIITPKCPLPVQRGVRMWWIMLNDIQYRRVQEIARAVQAKNKYILTKL